MLKKLGATAMLLLVIASLTLGSVSPVNAQAEKYGRSGNIMMYRSGMPGFMPPLMEMGIMTAGGPPGDKYTNVILDFSGQEAMPDESPGWHVPGFMPPFMGPRMMAGKSSIDAKMIIFPSGADAPRTFPVKFFRHMEAERGDKGTMVSYVMENTTFALNDNNSSFMTFKGEVFVRNGSVYYSNINTLPEDGYDNNITPGQTNWHQAEVSGTSTAFNFDLKWSNPNDDLRLMVYTPDGHVLGPYTDVSDGKTDGRINMEIDNPNGVADGTWSLKVTGTNVTGNDDYYIKTW